MDGWECVWMDVVMVGVLMYICLRTGMCIYFTSVHMYVDVYMHV